MSVSCSSWECNLFLERLTKILLLGCDRSNPIVVCTAGEGEGHPNPGQGQGQDEQRTTYKLAGCGEALPRPALPTAPANHWLPVLPQSSYVYSAYLDRRDEPLASVIRIIAISSEGVHKTHFCLLWYPDRAEPDVQPAHYDGIPEGHSKKSVYIYL